MYSGMNLMFHSCKWDFVIERVCRVCLCTTNPVSNIFTTVLASGDPVFQVLNLLFGLKVTLNDKLPPNICVSCLWKVKDFYGVKRNALFADAQLREMADELENEIDNEELPLSGETDIEEWKVPKDLIIPQDLEKSVEESMLLKKEISKQYHQSSCDISLQVTRNSFHLNYQEQVKNLHAEEKQRNFEIFDADSKQGEKKLKRGMIILNEGDRVENGPPMKRAALFDRFDDKVRVVYCHHCGECRQTKSDLINHIKYAHHTIFEEEKVVSANRIKHVCISSEKNFESKRNFHTKRKLFACDICDYKTYMSGNFKAHIRIHTGEKPFTCDICEYRSSEKGKLKRHTKIHTGEKPFACYFCEYRCSLGSALKRHIRIHTGEKRYVCDLCDCRFPRCEDLKAHIRKHSGEKPFVCKFRC